MRFERHIIVFAIVSVLIFSYISVSKAQYEPTVSLESRHESGATSNLGTITFDSIGYALPTSFQTPYFNHPITYNPAPGYSFVRWEVVITDDDGPPSSYVGDPNAQTTYVHVDSSIILRAIYSGEGSRTPSGQRYVGGEVFSANKLAVLSPYVALIGLAGVVASAAVLVKRRKL